MVVQGSHVRAVGPPSTCSKNLATALEELRRREDIEWVIEKLEGAGFMESKVNAVRTPTGRGRKKASTEGPVSAKRQLLTRSEDGGLPVEGLKWVIRELKLNTGKNFWKNHVTMEDFFKVLLFHFKARHPIRSKIGGAAETTRGGVLVTGNSKRRGASPASGAASNYERIRQGLMSARARHEIAAEKSTMYETPSYVGLLAPYQKGAPRKEVLPRSSSSSRPLVERGWRDFQTDTSEGILYQARAGLNRNWHTVKEIALRRKRLQSPELAGAPSTVFTMLAGQLASAGGGGDSSDYASEPQDLESNRQEDDARLMRRKCAKSIYELSTRADKGPLLIRNGALEALSALSLVDDPRTLRYVGASYVNVAALGREVCAEMLKSQVVRCLHRLWRHGCSLAFRTPRDDSDMFSESNDRSTGGYHETEASANETESEWRIRKCGLDILDQAAVALCRLTMPFGAESIMMHEKGMDAIMWYTRDEHHGNERLKVMGLQCLINFHVNTPTVAFHEAILPCLNRLGQSATTGIRRFTVQAICSLGANKAGASQLLAGGVLKILANLTKSQQQSSTYSSDGTHRDGGRGGKRALAVDGVLVEACAQAASNLTNTDTEFVRQALVAPETVAEVLEILFLGGGGVVGSGGASGVGDSSASGGDGGIEGHAGDRGSKRAAACRLNSARVLRSIFSKADPFDVARLVQLGFLVKLGHFFLQAQVQKDPKAQGLLAHSAWHLSVALADTRPVAPPPRPVSPVIVVRREEDVSVLSAGALQEQQQQQQQQQQHMQVKEGRAARRSSSIRSIGSNQGLPQGPKSVGRKYSDDSSSVAEVSTNQGTGVRIDAAAGTKAPPPADRAGTSMILPRKSNCIGLAQLSPLLAERAAAAREAAKDQRLGTAVAAATAAKKIGRKSGRPPPNIAIEEETDSDTSSRSRSAGGAPKPSGLMSRLDVLLPENATTLDPPAARAAAAAPAPAEEVVDERPHIVACGVMDHLLRLAESGMTGFIRECAAGALCNLARKPWITADVCSKIGMIQTFLRSIGLALTQGEEGTSTLAAKGLWNLVSRMSQERPFVQECLSLGVVGGLCGAAKGAADLLLALEEAAAEDAGERRSPVASFADSVATENIDELDDTNNNSNEAAGDEVFRRQMRATTKACLRSLHAILKHKWVRLDPLLKDMRKDLLIMLVSCSVGGTQVKEVAMAVMCNITHDLCCDLTILEETGALQSILQQTYSPSRVVLKHLSGVLGNLSSEIVSANGGGGHQLVERWTGRRGFTLFDTLRRLAYVDDERLAFRASAILYGLTRKSDYIDILPDLRGLGDIVFKLFRAGMTQTQNYCLQAFCNMARNKDFSASIAGAPEMMEGFIVGCMVHTNSSHMKEMSSEVIFYLISNPSTRRTALKGQGLWALVQLAAANGSAVSMRLALLVLFNLACDLHENARWLNEHTVAAVLDFDDEVLGAPAFAGLLYLASTHHGRLSQMLVSTRMALEARVKIEGAKFLKRDRAEEEDKTFMARTTAALRPSEADGDDSSSDDDNGRDRPRSVSTAYAAAGQRSRLRRTFVASHLMPTLATVYNLCCKKSAAATKLFFREGVPEAVAGLLEEMRGTEEPSYYHPHVEIMCVAVLGTMIEDPALVPKLIERRITPAITSGLGSRIVAVRLISLWSLLLLGIPGSGASSGMNRAAAAASAAASVSATTTRSSSAAAGDSHNTVGLPLRMWMLFCREAVVECKAVSALWALWAGGTAASLEPEAREHVRFAVSTVTRIFFMDKVAASAAVRQRGAELLAMTMDFSDESRARSPLSISEHDFQYDESSSPLVKVSALCCAVVTVHLRDIPWESVLSVCEGCLDVFLKILPTDDPEVRDLCSLAMRCLAEHEELLLHLLFEPRFTTVLQVLLEEATPSGGVHVEAILKRVVVRSATPGVDDLSPTLLNLTDYVFQRRSRRSSKAWANGSGTAGSRSPSSVSSSLSVSAPGGARGESISLPRNVSRGGNGNTNKVARAGSTRSATRPLTGSKQHHSSNAIVGGASGSAVNARAHRMARLRATQRASSLSMRGGSSSASGSEKERATVERGPAAAAAPATEDQTEPDSTCVNQGATAVGTPDSKFNVFQDVVDRLGDADPEEDDNAHADGGGGGGGDKEVPAEDARLAGPRKEPIPTSAPREEEGPGSSTPAHLSPEFLAKATKVARATATNGPALTATRVGKHESVAVWGLNPSAASLSQKKDGAITSSVGSGSDRDFQTGPEGPGLRSEPRSMLESLNDEDDDDITESSGDNDLEITYNDDEIRQVKRLVFRVVEAELSTTIVESIMEVVTQLREVARRQCTAFQQTSQEFRKHILSTRKGQALVLPRSSGPFGNGKAAATAPPSRESTPDSAVSVSPSVMPKPAEGLPATNWDPAKQLLVLMGMKELPMVPGWEFTSTTNLKSNSGPKKANLCTTKFVDDSKTVASTEVAVPIPLPEDLVHFTRKGDAEMPTGLERCILPPLERPTPDQAVAESMEPGEETSSLTNGAAAEQLVQDDIEDAKTSVSCDENAVSDTTSPSNIVNARPSRRGSGGGPKTGGMPRGASFRRSRYNSAKISGVLTGRRESEVVTSGAATRTNDSSRRGTIKARHRRNSAMGTGESGGVERAASDGGCAGGRLASKGREEKGRVTATTVPSWNASNLSACSLDAMFASNPLLVALSLARGLQPVPFTTGGGVAISGCGGDRERGFTNRSFVPALAADASSLRMRRSLEEREASRERRNLLKSLGVGTRR